MTSIIAHRTCPPNAPENSLAGMRVATELKADGVEVDLRLSLDQKPFLLHDWTMGRTTGFPLPLELTPSLVVRRLRLEGGSQPVPSLADCYEALASEMLLAVDVKNPLAAKALVREAQSRGMEARTLAWCASAWAVRYVVRNAPSIETAYLKNARRASDKRAFVAKARELGAAAISAHWQAIDREFVDQAHEAGLRVYSYHQAFDLTPEKLSAGLDGLITDFPQDARAALDSTPG